MKILSKDDQLRAGNSLYLFVSSFPCSSITMFFHFGIARSKANRLHDWRGVYSICALNRAESGRPPQHTFWVPWYSHS